MQLVPERIEALFQEISAKALFHTLRVASSNDPMRHVFKPPHTRFIVSAWGVRRDDYRWGKGVDDQDLSAFREAASAAAEFLLSSPLAPWQELLPGSMEDIMGTQSRLYLADYWVLVLHHLVWAKHLPYAIKAEWIEGSSIHDDDFYFVSELPVDLVEASKDALILFQETATAALMEGRSLLDICECGFCAEPPICRDGRWRMVAPNQPSAGEDEQFGAVPEVNEDDQNVPEIDAVLELDDQTFVARLGSRSCPFSARNKLLFMLLERISRRPGYRVSFDDLRLVGDVWDGSPVEDSTIRGSVTRLRRLLKKRGLDPVAARISTATYRGGGYVIMKSAESSES